MGAYKIILSGGGTGGHIYPAIAIANELRMRYPDTKFLFIGAKNKMEMEKVPNAGFKIEGLWISGLKRNVNISNLLFPFKLISSLFKAWKILRRFKPDAVIGTGGYASGPILYMAAIKGIPNLIQEQNSYPGITNKLLGNKADRICVAYDNLEHFFPKDKIVLTGNPVRQDLTDISLKINKAKNFYNLNSNQKTLLVIGGSLGARRINQLIESKQSFLSKNKIQVIWQCGKFYYEEYRKYNNLEHIQVHAFLNKMSYAYAAADFIISRAGAIAVSELCLVAKPTFFIPSPNVTEDHQTKNALAIAEKNGAVVIKEEDLEVHFEATFKAILNSKEKQMALSENMKKIAKKNATKDIADQVVCLLRK